eukprot:TRINITY_DN438_c0_g2_i6.p1 TRINITY_DN438_c0_g2~~TRINITY_DN438_c0_g2_i6.p1  ORF type:complete len:321 (+),score=61.73 TRINITY_DN438_c0_g2_i6:70-1032(+)
MKPCAAFGVLILVWVWWTCIMMLNVHLEEVIGRQILLTETIANRRVETTTHDAGITAHLSTAPAEETDRDYNTTIQYYNWFGGLGWVVVCLLPTIVLIDDHNVALFFSCGCALAFYVTMATMGFLEPNLSWRQLELAERSLASGGEALIGCHIAPNPSALTIKTNITYYTLVDEEWGLDWGRKSVKSERGSSWVSAPIVYTGSVKGCKFDPPVYAGCIAKGPTAKDCGFEQNAAFTIIRKLAQSEYLESEQRDKIPYSGPSRFHHMMEFNSQSRFQTQQYVDKITGYKDDQWRNICIAWFIVTGVMLLIATALTKFDIEK